MKILLSIEGFKLGKCYMDMRKSLFRLVRNKTVDEKFGSKRIHMNFIPHPLKVRSIMVERKSTGVE